MEKSDEIFEITLNSGPFADTPLLVRPEETTDGIPIYHCYVDGSSRSQLRRETTGEWLQLWGDFSTDTVRLIGKAIEEQRLDK